MPQLQQTGENHRSVLQWDAAAGTRRNGLIWPVLLLLSCLILYGSGLAKLPPIDRDEARFAQATRQMIEEHDYVRIRFQQEARHKKPVGIHWLQAAVVGITGTAEGNVIWPYRIPSALGAMLAVWLTVLLGRQWLAEKTAALGAFLLASCLLLVVEAHQATTDAMLLAAVSAAQGALGQSYMRAKRAEPVGIGIALTFWAAQGVGVLLKGPVIVMISGATVLALWIVDRQAGWLRVLRWRLGLPLFVAITCPWAIAVGLATKGAFFYDAVKSDLFPKLVSGQESHGFPPGYYLLLLPVTFWPASLLLGPALLRAWRLRSQPAERFCLAWIIPCWLIFELVPTKLPHYVLPLYPAFALLTAEAIMASRPAEFPGVRSVPARIGFACWGFIGLGLAAGMVVLPWVMGDRLEPVALLPALAALTVATVPVWLVFRGRMLKAAVVGVAGAVLVLAPVFHWLLPDTNGLWLSRTVARQVERFAWPRSHLPDPVAAAGYHEPSLVFLLGTGTKLLAPEQAAFYLNERPESLVVISDKVDTLFRQTAAQCGITVRLLQTVDGFNYTKGRWMTLRIYGRD